MNIKRFLMLAALAVCAAAITSCDSDEVLQYNLNDIATLDGGKFITDDGIIYNIVENKAEGSLDKVTRAYINFDVFKMVEGSKNEYDIRLNGFGNVKIQNTPRLSECDMEKIGSDAINIFQGWFSGTYFNAQVQYTYKLGSKKEHSYTLVLDDSRNNSDTLHVRLFHNAFGESYDNESFDRNSVDINNEMVSFDMAEYLSEIKDGKYVEFKWNWFKNAGGYLSREKEETKAVIAYIKKTL